MMTPLNLAKKVQQALLDKKGEQVKALNVQDLSDVTDYMLIASGSSAPHLKALAEEVQRQLKLEGYACYRRAGDPDSGWIVIDYIDVVIHILSTEARSYYALEDLWAEAPQVD